MRKTVSILNFCIERIKQFRSLEAYCELSDICSTRKQVKGVGVSSIIIIIMMNLISQQKHLTECIRKKAFLKRKQTNCQFEIYKYHLVSEFWAAWILVQYEHWMHFFFYMILITYKGECLNRIQPGHEGLNPVLAFHITT